MAEAIFFVSNLRFEEFNEQTQPKLETKKDGCCHPLYKVSVLKKKRAGPGAEPP